MSDDNIIDLDDHRAGCYYSFWAMCLPCSHRWIAIVTIEVSIFKLTCPKCEAQESFASPIPQNYTEHLNEWAKAKNKKGEDSDV